MFPTISMLSIYFFYGGIGMLALRVALAAIFLVHGWPKLKDLRKTAVQFSGMGFKPGFFWGALVALLEVSGGLAIAVGILTTTFASLLTLQFLVILAWRSVRPHSSTAVWELDVIIFAALLVLATNGPGIYALDRIFFL